MFVVTFPDRPQRSISSTFVHSSLSFSCSIHLQNLLLSVSLHNLLPVAAHLQLCRILPITISQSLHAPPSKCEGWVFVWLGVMTLSFPKNASEGGQSLMTWNVTRNILVMTAKHPGETQQCRLKDNTSQVPLECHQLDLGHFPWITTFMTGTLNNDPTFSGPQR